MIQSFYVYVLSKSKTKTKVGPLIDSKNMQVEEEEQMCEILIKYFGSVFTLERLELISGNCIAGQKIGKCCLPSINVK